MQMSTVEWEKLMKEYGALPVNMCQLDWEAVYAAIPDYVAFSLQALLGQLAVETDNKPMEAISKAMFASMLKSHGLTDSLFDMQHITPIICECIKKIYTEFNSKHPAVREGLCEIELTD